VGWRYFVYIIGCITFFMFICRFFFFHLFESPKFLLSRGRQAEAVAVVHGIAYFNKSKTWLTEDILNQIGGDPEVVNEKFSTVEIIKRNLSKFSGDHIRPLFNGRSLAMTTILLWFIWSSIGMGYPLFNAFLPQYLGGGDTSPSIQYRNYAITSAVGVPGSLLACYTVDLKYIGRKGTMAFATVVSGILICLFTTSKDSNTQLVYSSLEAFFQNIMYGVLYAYTPEVFRSCSPSLSLPPFSLSLKFIITFTQIHSHDPLPHSNFMHNNPNRRQNIPSLRRPAHTGERAAGSGACVLDCGTL
jgi:hypothetical protein